MGATRLDVTSSWDRAVSLIERHAIDALFIMKPANLPYLTGDGMVLALGNCGIYLTSAPKSPRV